MITNDFQDSRRRALAALGAGLSGLACASPLGAATLMLTPPQTRGPFYPLTLPLESDNDLVRVEGGDGLARGVITQLTGRVLDAGGRPVPRARVEIWQCDANGRYHHPLDRRRAPLDPNFQGYGRYQVGSDGAYRFRTIRPVPYPGRAPHVHFTVSGPGMPPLVTQMYVEGAPENRWDRILNGIPDPRARERVVVAFEPHPENPGELWARFDLVLAADGRSG